MARLLPPGTLSVREVAQQERISKHTVCRWRKGAREQGRSRPNSGDGGTAASPSKDKFGEVLVTAAMNGAELAEYSRRRGVYPEQIAAWRQDLRRRKPKTPGLYCELAHSRSTNRSCSCIENVWL